MPGCVVSPPGLLPDGRRREPGAGSWRRSDLLEVLPHRPLDLRETGWTVGVRECEIGRIHGMGLVICPLRDPELTTRGRSCIVSNEAADATDGEQCRGDERLSHQNGKRLTTGLHHGASIFHFLVPPLAGNAHHFVLGRQSDIYLFHVQQIRLDEICLSSSVLSTRGDQSVPVLASFQASVRTAGRPGEVERRCTISSKSLKGFQRVFGSHGGNVDRREPPWN